MAGVTSVHLQDGSLLSLEPHTSLSVREQSGQSVELALGFGRVSCDVTYAPERVFRVVAAGHEVLVRGTRFLVELSHERNELAVEVESGRVEVRREGAELAEAALGAGQRWSVALAPPIGSATPGAAPSNARSPQPVAVPPDADASLAPTGARLPGQSMPSASGERALAPAGAVRNRVAEQDGNVKRGTVAEDGARALLDRANAARRRGDLAAAALAYEQLLRQHAGDARMGLAAFELGRLRMDEFHDVHGAIEVLQLAAQAAKEDALREDALARLVRAHHILRQGERCRSARAEYLQAYPRGAHVLPVLNACDGP